MTSKKAYSTLTRAAGVVVFKILPLLLCTLARAQNGSWSTQAPMPTARGGLAAAAVNTTVYALGGIKPASIDTFYTTVEAYSPETDSWVTKGLLPGPCAYGGAGVINGVVYVVGCGSPTYAYDPSSSTWASRADLPTPRSGAAVAVRDGILYVIGGLKVGYFNTVYSSVEAYNPGANSWEAKAPIPTSRYYACAGVIGGSIYVAGGARPVGPSVSESLATLEAYDPKTEMWTAKTPMPTARRGAACAVVDGELYVISGNLTDYADSVRNIVEVYNPQTNTWRTGAPIPTPRFSSGAVTVADTLYVVGGLDAHDRTLAVNEAFSPFLAVGIDIKPDDPDNTINLKSRGTVPVAILGSATFDPTTVDPATVTLAGAPVATRPNGVPMTSITDVNADGYLDLLLHFRTQDLQLTRTSTEGVLYGGTFSGQRIRGADAVRIVAWDRLLRSNPWTEGPNGRRHLPTD